MKAKDCFFIVAFLILAALVYNLFLETAAAQPIPQNNVPDSSNVSLIGRWAHGPCQAVAVNAIGTIAYFGNGSYLEIVNISNPGNPNKLSKLLLPDAVLGVAVNGSYAYVANAGAGLRIINIDIPSSPVQIAYLETLGSASGLAIDGTKIYVADGDSLLIIDISNPWLPKQMGICDTDGWACRVAANNSFVYVADKQGGLQVIDVTDPHIPNPVGNYTTTDGAMDVAISGVHAYLAAGSAGLRVVDISMPNTDPVETGYLDIFQFATAIAVSGTHAYLTDRETGLWIIDISRPDDPQAIGHLDTDGSPCDVALFGNSALVADGPNGLRIINADNYYDPKEIGYFETDGFSRGIAVDNDYAYLVKREAGLRVIDLANRSKPVMLDSLNLTGQAEDVVLNVNHAYLTNYENGLRIIDIADPLGMKVIGAITQDVNSKRVAIKDKYAYVADTTFGLRVIDITTPSQPILINSLEFPGKQAEAIVIKENYAYLAAGDDGLIIVDIATPSQPQQIGSRDVGGTAISLDVDDNLAYVGTLQNDLKIINISDPAQPNIVGVLPLLSSPLYELIAKARYVYVANGTSGLRVIDVMNPADPKEVGFYVAGSTAFGLTLDENYIYLSCEETGLFILKFLLALDNKPPLAPMLTLPKNNSFVNNTASQLTWQIPTDANGDLLHFKIELDQDENWGNIDHVVESKKDTAGFSPIPPVASGSGAMNYSMQLPLTEATWHWRVAAFDGSVYGPYSMIWSFTVDTTAPALNRLTFENAGYDENWFNPQQDTLVTLVIIYSELYPRISLLSGGMLSTALRDSNLAGGFDQAVRFSFSIANQRDGAFSLEASIQDSAGNIGRKAGAIQFDRTPPVGYYSDAPDSIAEDRNYIVHVSGASDSLGCGVAQIYLDVFKDAAGVPTTAQDSMVGVIEPGIYFYRYFAEDHLGNRGEMKTDTTVVIPVYAAAPIFLTTPSNEVNAGDEFWIDIQVGTTGQPVENLFHVNFVLSYSNAQYVDVVSQDSIALGNWFGEDADLASQIDDPNGKITIAISKKSGARNIDGYGTLTRIKYDSDPNTPDRTAIDFKIVSVTANDSAGYPIELIPRDTTIGIIQPYADFAMTVAPDSQTIPQGDSADFNISFEPLGVFDSPVSLSITGLPDGMTAIYETQAYDIPATDTIRFVTSVAMTPGVYSPIITGTGGGISHVDTVIITVLPKTVLSDFVMTVQPDSQASYPGESTNFTVACQGTGNFNSRIRLVISNLPAGMQANYPSAPFSIPDSFDVKFSTDTDISPGSYKPIFTATGGGLTHADTVSIIILPKPIPASFIITVVPDSQTIYQGESTNFTATFQPIGEFVSPIRLAILNLPAGLQAKYPVAPFSIPDSFEVTFSTNTDISPGSYEPIFIATGGGISHSDTVTIIVLRGSNPSDFSMTVVPDSQTIYQGESTDFTLSFQRIGDFDAPVSLEISNLPLGMTVAYPSDPFAIPKSFNITFSTVADIEPGVHHPAISATGGGITHQATVTIIVLQRMDFIMTIEPDSQAVSAGDSIEFYISFTPVGGFNSQITVSVSNVPTGMDARYTSRPISIPFSITVTFRVLRNIPIDVYHPIVTATGGGITHQETVAVNVLPKPLDIQAVTVLPNPFTPNNDGYNDHAEFLFSETLSGNVSISILDVNGRKIIEIQNSRLWYGKDERGSDVKPGAYIYIVKNGEKVVGKGVISVAR